MLVNRRQFLVTSLGTIALAVIPPSPEIRLRLGVIGLGTQGSRLLQELVSLSAALPIEIAAICDVRPEALDQAAQIAPQTRQSTHYAAILEDVDAVIVAVPDHHHAEIAEAVLNAGLALYLEPPLAHTIQEAEQLIQLAERSGSTVQLGLHQLSHPAFSIARDIIRSSALGKISRIEAAFPPEEVPDWQLFRDYSDGIGMFRLIQVAEIIRQVMDTSFPVRVAAQGSTSFQAGDNPDTLHVLLSYPEGFLLNFSMGLGSSAFNIYGTRGTLDLLNWQVEIPSDLPEQAALSEQLQVAQSQNPMQAHLQDWIDSIQQRRTPRLPIQAGYEQAKLAEAVWSAYNKSL